MKFLKYFILSILLAFILQVMAFAVDISGLYNMTYEGQENYVEVFKKNNKYYAVAFSNKKEVNEGINNKEAVESSDKSVFIWNLEEKKQGRFTNGRIYNFKNGKIYYVKAKVDKNDILKVTISEDAGGVLGKTLKWKRLTQSEIDSLQSRRVDVNKLKLPK